MLVLSDSLRRAEKLYADREAVACGDTRLTYAAFATRVRKLAGALRALGVEKGDRVAVLMANCHRYLEAYYAVPGIGAVLVPLNNRHAVPEHEYILDDCQVRVLIVDEAHEAVAEKLTHVVKEVLRAPAGYEEALAAAEEVALGPENGFGEEDLAGLFYTGGTTGASKGVMLSHRNLTANALNITIAAEYTDADVYMHAGPMFHLADGASTYAITWVGGRHAFVPAFEPGAVLDLIENERVTATIIVPAMINSLVNDPRVDDADLSSLRLVSHGGAPIAPDLCRRAVEKLGCSLLQAYGMTEAAPLLTVLPKEETLLDQEAIKSAGREIVGVEVTVRREDGSLCDVREVGEIVARGANIMHGYWNKPEQTAAVLRDGWYWSGDLAYRDEQHYLYIVDRAKDMIISGGENVYSTEVEHAIYAHPAVLEAAVIGVPDEQWGERVHACVVLKPGQALTAEELRDFCKERIAGYKAPRTVEFLDALPKSGAGKILKRDLRDAFWGDQGRRVN